MVLSLADGEVRHHKPVLYQTIKGVRQEVAGNFVVRGKQVSFAVGEYDRTKELVIDPTLNYSTYLGGDDGDEKGYAIALDGSSNAYLTGEVASTTFIDDDIAGASSGGNDIFVAKLLANGSDIDFYTFIGGGGDEWGTAIGRNSSNGDILVAGRFGTNSFVPGVSGYVTTDPSSTTDDAFVLRLTSGGALDKFTYLGGNGLDSANGIAVDGDNVFVVGHSFSNNFPTNGTNTAYNTAHGGQADVFVSKLTNRVVAMGQLAATCCEA